MSSKPWIAATGLLAAGTLVAVGIANATTPTKIPDSSTGVITACMVKKTGAVRFINAQAGKVCKTGEKKITFNQTGPAGQVGPTGATGPRGPSSTFVKNTNVLATAVTTAGTDVVSLTLPAGNYLLSAQTSMDKSDAAMTNVFCQFQASTGTVTADPAFWIPQTAPVGTVTPMTLTGTLTGATDGTVVDMHCRSAGADTLVLAGGVVTATTVGEVTVQ